MIPRRQVEGVYIDDLDTEKPLLRYEDSHGQLNLETLLKHQMCTYARHAHVCNMHLPFLTLDERYVRGVRMLLYTNYSPDPVPRWLSLRRLEFGLVRRDRLRFSEAYECITMSS